MNLKHLLLLLNLCLAVLVLWAASNIVLTWRSSKEEKARPQTKLADSTDAIEPSSERPKKLKEYQIIINRDIFHTTKEASTKKKEKIAKTTDLNLKLKGTIVGGNRNSFAIIHDGTTMKEELYSLNDFVQGARIVEILSDQVILSLKGSKEALMMVEDSSPVAPKIRPRKRVKAPRFKPPRTRRSRIKRPKRPKI